MKTISTGGVTFIELVPGGTSEWYYGSSLTHGDLYEAEELFRMGREIEGRKLCLVRYPDGAVFWPAPKTAGRPWRWSSSPAAPTAASSWTCRCPS